MTSNESICLREPLPSAVSVHETQDTEQAASHLDEADPRQVESNRKRICVLLGSAILQLPIWGKIHPTPSLHSTHTRRFRHDIWRLPRILFQQLDAARKSTRHRYNRHNLQRRHVPLHAVPIRALHPKMGPQTPKRCSMRRGAHMRQLPAVVVQHSRLAFGGDAGSHGCVGMCSRLQSDHAVAW